MKARRALLYVPGDDSHKIQKAAGLDVDAVILDMEDGVAQNRKDAAREMIAGALSEIDFGRSEKLVRINPIETGGGEKDLRKVISARPDGIVIPKISSSKPLLIADKIISQEEHHQNWQENSISILAIIETASAFLNLKEICECTSRLDGLVFGGEDLAADLGATRTGEATELLFARSLLVVHASAYGLQAIDMVTVDFKNEMIIRRESEFGARLGYTGKQIIHPSQVEPVQKAFSPSGIELRQARELIAAFEEHQKIGKGAFAFKGRMVDMPVIRRARNLMERADESKRSAIP